MRINGVFCGNMLGCCFLVAQYASEYHQRKLAAAQEKQDKRAYEMRVRVVGCGCAKCVGAEAPEEREALLKRRDV